jgi:uncharacterized protein (DUF1778 family)
MLSWIDAEEEDMPVLAGRRISPDATLALADSLTEAGCERTAGVLRAAIADAQEFLVLSQEDRAAILAVLKPPPEGLEELRTVLYAEMLWRRNPRLEGRRRPEAILARSIRSGD